MSSENILAVLDDILSGNKSYEGIKKAKTEAFTMFKLGIVTYSQYVRILRVIEANK